ncbi:hypothetical protein KQI84_05820 [bacterium]|nr:hypothetical protein [bacterium]
MTRRPSSKTKTRVRRSTAKSAKIRKRKEPAPVTLRIRDLLAILLAGAMATGMGLTIVKMRFQARDYEIEAARLQELTTARRDEAKRLEARLGLMQRDEVLRETAIEELGMIDPDPSAVEELTMNEERVAAYREAQQEAREELEAKRRQLAAWQKEVF